MAQQKIFTNQNTMHYNGDTQMADINQQEREEFQALIRGHGGESPRSFTASAGVQSSPVGGFTPVGQAIGAGIDTVSSIAKNTADALSTIASTPISVKNADGTETVSPFGQQGNLLQSIGQLGQSLPYALPAGFVSNTDRLFLYNNEQLRANEALRIAKTLNIGADTVMFGDDRAFERADYLSRRVERGQVLQDIYDEFPELYKVKYGSQAEGIQALNNIESIKNTKGVFDALQQSIWAMNDQMKLGDVGFALAYESDPQKISELTAEVNRLQNNLQNYRRPDGGSPLQEVLGSTASQIYMMGKQGGTGAIVGGIIGGIGGGVVSGGSAAIPTAMTGAKWLGSADMAYEMYKMSFGNKYLELIGKRDQKGNRVYSNEEAKEYAMSFAAIDASIEFVATRTIGKAATKIAPKSALASAISRGTTNAAETFNRGIGVTAAQVAKSSIKAGAPELFEEGLQDVNEKLQHNLWRKSNDQEGPYSAGDMFVGAGEAMWQALPAVVGFGVIGGGISGARTMKAFKDFQKLSPEEQHMAVMEEQNRNGHVIMQNLKNDAAANNLAKENPELYGKIVQAQGDNIGVSTAYVNVNEMAETAEGQAAIRNMVDAGLTTQEEVSKAITADAPIEIPIGSYAQLSGGLSEETVKALEESSYFTRGGLSMKTLERAKEEVHAMKDLVKDDTEKRAERVKNDIIRSYFDEVSDVDKEMLDVVLADPTHIKQTFNNVYKELTEQYREQYTSDFDAMDTDLETARTSGVNPTWLGDNKAPRSNSERRRMAYQSSLARTQSALADNPEALNQAGAHYADMEHTLKQIESLESMRDTLFELADNDIALRMQLSKSGYEVYQSLKSIMSDETVDRKQRDTAEANALLMAQHADVMAQYMRQMGRGGYTAMDYFRDSVRINMNAKLKNQKGYNQLDQDARLKLSIDKKKWSRIIDNISSYKRSDLISVMDTPAVLQLVGVKDLPIKMYVSKYFDMKTGAGKNNQHKTVTNKMWKQLPSALVDPIAIFPSKTVNGSIVVMTEITDSNKKQSIVALELSASVANNITINRIKSFYPKDNASANMWFYNNFADKNNPPLYINEQKTTRWFTRNGLQLPYQVNQSSGYFNKSIPNENDLSNYRNANSNIFYQSAWHGSPHDFDTFDLGAIGTGEGNQVHGWGLYFAKDKKVSDLYRRELSLIHDVDKGTLFKVDVPDTKEMIDEQQSLNILSKETKQNLNAAINALPEQEKEVFINEYTNSPLFNHYAKKEIDELGSKFEQLDNEYRLLKDEYLDKFLKEDLNKITQRNLNRLSEKYNIDLKALKENPNIIKDIKNQLDTMWFNAFKEFGMTKQRYRDTYWGKYKKDFSTLLNDGGINGRDFYLALSKALGSAKQASEHLNEYGVKGITYVGEQDGRCYVVFDDKAIKVIEKYNQSINGMTEIMKDGERIINIFKTADRSTFLHEMGHVFFDDIQKLASMENAPEQLVTDWNKLKEWSGWVDGENVDNTKAHEKFARGWESYLRSGEAPTSALQRVFRQFSKWLTFIYRSVQRLGGEVPTDIKDVMARMIATQEDIEAYAEQQQLEQFEKTELYKQLSEQDQARMQSYIADVKEKAKERVMRKLMKELDNRPIKEWEEEKDAIQVEIEKRLIEQYPIYKEHQRYNVFGDGALKDTQYNSIEELEEAEVEQTGATFNDAINQEMDNAKAEFMRDNNVGKTNEQIAEEILLSTQGQMRLTEEESKIIQKSTNRELAKNWELLERIRKLDPNAETIDTELSEIEKEVKPTKYDELKADKKKVDAALTDTTKQLEKAEDRIKRLEDALQDRINNVRSIRGAGLGTISDYMNRARKELGELPISNAIQFKTYQNKAVTAGKKADRALASGKVDKALGYKREQMLQQARARVAFENFEKSKKLRLKLKQQLQRMTRPKNPIAIEPNMRYFYSHMAYQMGLTKYDGLPPTDGFDMNTVLSALDVDALILNQQSMVQLEPWIAEMFYAKTPKSFKSITMNELETLEELMTGMYKNGRNEYEGTTILNDEGKSISFENAVQEIIGEATETFGGATGDVFNILNNQTKTDAVSGKLYGFHLALMKVETFLRRMGGGKNGFAVKYIYDPISRATQAFNERKEVSMRRLAKDVGIYSKRELFNMRNEHLYTVGNLYGLTKEQLIMIALNWGTESNRQRVMETTKANEVEIERAFQEHMTDKDWEFIIRTWDHINSFFDERSKVQEELYGNPLKKVEGLTFSIGGRNIEGQYFPIVYNPKVNASVSDNQVEDIAKTMVSSNAVWGTGMSATKSRLDVVKDKSLLLDFDVIPNAITEAINHVTMRKAVTDVNKLISNRELQNYIVDKFGADTYQFLRTWVRDNWQDEAAKTNDIDRLILTLKKNTSTAVMAGRVSVALQNALNIPVAFYRIGVGNTIRAINHAGIGFYGHGTTTYNNTRDFVLGQSIFMRERIQTLDKDLKQGLSIAGKGLRLGDTNVGGYKVEQLADIRDDINQMGFRLLTETDFALSVPVWKFAYDQKQAELFGKEGVSAEWVEQQSIEAGDRAVRDIFGSGDTKDAAAIQRSRSTFTQLFVPFYSYANTLYNIITEGNYARKDNGDYARFVKMLWWTLISQAIGMMAYKALTNGDDDKPEDLAKSFIEELVAQGTMGVPIIRDMSNMAMKYILGEKVFNKGNSVMALSIVEKFYDLGNAIMSDKKDGIDVGRSFSQLANRATGFSDTVTDGLWTLAKFGFTDTDASLEDVIMAVAFDRRLKTKKEKKKQH
nr:MAG TPA: crystallin beta/gamma motif-containing protein [Caudoviricetes sp.]